VNESVYWSAIIVGALALFVPVLVLWVSGRLGPRRPNDAKSSVYECGITPQVDARRRFSAKFYLVAILFVVFDIEVAFLIPWAVVFRTLSESGFAVLWEMALFLGVLVLGLVYVIKRGALQWE
jgi:NADH-quinone oxidoreductase subunit A